MRVSNNTITFTFVIYYQSISTSNDTITFTIALVTSKLHTSVALHRSIQCNVY